MTDILLLLIGAIFVNNLVLTQLLGICPLMPGAGKLASGMAAATTVVLTLASIATWLIYHYLLLPFGVVFLRTVFYILTVATIVSLAGLWFRNSAPLLYRSLDNFMLLVIANSAVLGTALINDSRANSLIEAAFYGLGAGAGFSLVLILFSALRERLAGSDIPAPFQGSAIALITIGLMSLAFMGFAGLI